MGRIATLSLCMTLAGAGALRAESAFDIVFRSGTLDGLPEGSELHYDGSGLSQAERDTDWSRVVVGLDDGAARVEAAAPDAEERRVLGSFPAGVGNPIAMVFLERTVKDISEATGGSPFYIRNRMREALAADGAVGAATADWEGREVPATEVVLVPFAQDARRAELGRFADLEIRVVVSEEVPGWYSSISAEAPAAEGGAPYATSVALREVER